jgi:hypothetical protein
MNDALLPARFLFRFSLPCCYRHPLWTPRGAGLDERYRLVHLAELEDRATPADVHNAHRAGRFCHRFVFLPAGAGPKFDRPVAEWLPIHRAREHPRAIKPGQLQVRSEKRIDGYLLEGFIPAEALTGFDPQEHPRLGFNYAVTDRELGEQTLTAGTPMPYQEDPSLWATLELASEG